MRHGVHTILIIGLLSFAAAGRIAAVPLDEALHALDDCVAQVFATHSTVFEDAPLDLDSVCLELSAQLDKQVFTRLHPPLLRKTTFRQLQDARRGLASFVTTPNASIQALDHTGLASLLEEVYEPYVKPEMPPNPIDKFWSWVGDKLREFFDENNWLTRHLDFTPDKDSDLFTGLKNTLIVILIVFMLYIIVSELRAGNVLALLKRRRQRYTRMENAAQTASTQTVRHLGDIRHLTLQQQVPALLRYAIKTLIDQQVLPRQYSLTNREFLALVHDNAPGVAAGFESLVNTGERVVYGKQTLPPERTADLFEQVRLIEHASGKTPS